jgi:hypothetical protein
VSNPWGLVLLAAVAALASLVVLHRLLRPLAPTLPYRRIDSLLTPAERAFYEVLQGVVGDDLHLFVKVRLADLVALPRTVDNRQAHLSRIASKHIDFVLCERRTVAPVLAVELDDSSHQAGPRRQRDALVNDVLQAAGLPLLRVPVKRSYVPDEVAALVGGARKRPTRKASSRR